MADKKISELVPLTGALSANDGLPIADMSASQTKQISPKSLIEKGMILIDDRSIPASKVDLGTLPDGSVDSNELADRAVTAAKLDDNSSGIVGSGAPANGIRIGQVALNTVDNRFYMWSGSQWIAVKAAGSVNEIIADPNGLVQIDVTVDGDSVTLTGFLAPTTAPAEFLAGPTASNGNVIARPIVGADLPNATDTSKGAVSVPGNGLKVEEGAISIDNAVTPNNAATLHIVEYDQFGLVKSGREIAGGDLPNAQPGVSGVIKPGTGLAVDADGVLNHINAVTSSQATKVLWDSQGHITGSTPLLEEDLPDISADKISGGQLDGNLILDRSIQEVKLSDYSTCLMQEGQPSGDYKLGQMWFTPSTSQLRVYGRGSGSQDLWYSVGFGALQSQNLRWAGTINASTSTIVTLTDIGVSEGLTAGGPIPTPTDELSGIYFVVQESGSGISLLDVSGETFTEGDWLLCIDQAQGYTHIDISASGGGGGGASKLADLTDVNLTNPEADQFLQYDAISGMWINAADVDGGTF